MKSNIKMKSLGLFLMMSSLSGCINVDLVACFTTDTNGVLTCAPKDEKQLLLSEVTVTTTADEFIEIYNAGDSAFALSNVYLTDIIADNSINYYNITDGTLASAILSSSDFMVRFPDGASIDAGEYQTISIAGSTDFVATYTNKPDYEITPTDPSVADMVAAFPNAIGSNLGLSNGREGLVMFEWDGSSDLVTDLDYILWGDAGIAVDKSSISIDGVDADSDVSYYLNDTSVGMQAFTATHTAGESLQRKDNTEGSEKKTGGNGLNGHDETSENVADTWCIAAPTPGAAHACP